MVVVEYKPLDLPLVCQLRRGTPRLCRSLILRRDPSPSRWTVLIPLLSEFRVRCIDSHCCLACEVYSTAGRRLQCRKRTGGLEETLGCSTPAPAGCALRVTKWTSLYRTSGLGWMPIVVRLQSAAVAYPSEHFMTSGLAAVSKSLTCAESMVSFRPS